MSDELKQSKISLAGDRPMDLSHCADEDLASLDENQRANIELVGKAMLSYITAATNLLEGKYSHVRNLAPPYLRSPGKVLVTCCTDGMAVRFESNAGRPEVVVGWSDEPLPAMITKLSQNLIHCHLDRLPEPIPTDGIELTIIKSSPGGPREAIATIKVRFDAVIKPPERLPGPPNKPFSLLSVRNELELHLRPVEHIRSSDERVIVRTTVRLPVGWDCIEAYPAFDPAQWKPEYAELWAENDTLAAIMAHQFRESVYQSLDPNSAARREYGKLLASYKDLLDSNPEREETLQSFLGEHPALLSPTHTKMWSKLALGSRKTDFVFRDAVGDYLLVELERSTHPLFRRDGHLSAELTHAQGQVIDWKRYLEDNLSTVQRELGLTGISTYPKSMIVIGRSASLTAEQRRKLISIENDSPKIKIMTYDDVYANAKTTIENLLGPISVTEGFTQVYYIPGK